MSVETVSYAEAAAFNGVDKPSRRVNGFDSAALKDNGILGSLNDYYQKPSAPNAKPSAPIIETRPPGKSYTIALKQYPVTLHRKPYVPDEHDPLVDPGTPRANIAPTTEKPDGTTEERWAELHRHQTVVVQHADFWDHDHDGVVWPIDTYRGFRELGWSIILSIIGTLFINGALSYPTCPTLLPDPFFRVFIVRLHKAKHGSDSMSYDHEGRFRPQQFEEIFTKYDRDNKGGLSKGDLWAMWKGQAFVWDFFGWAATAFEWVATYVLIWPEDGILRKEDVRGVFDGSIFYTIAERHRQKTGYVRRQRQHKRMQ